MLTDADFEGGFGPPPRQCATCRYHGIRWTADGGRERVVLSARSADPRQGGDGKVNQTCTECGASPSAGILLNDRWTCNNCIRVNTTPAWALRASQSRKLLQQWAYDSQFEMGRYKRH